MDASTSSPCVEFGILGPLTVTVGGRPIQPGGRKLRALLALLLVHANRLVLTDTLIDALWTGAPPPGAANTLQSHVSHLRRLLGSAGARVWNEHGGYRLECDPASFDAARFEQLLVDGRATTDPARATARLGEALSLWRGRPLAEFEQDAWAMPEVARLDGLRLVASECRADAELALGRHGPLIVELEGLVAAHPMRERVWAQLIVARYRSGRQVDALRAYQQLRGVLGDVGVEPSVALVELERAILDHSDELPGFPAVRFTRSRPRLPAFLGAEESSPLVGRRAEQDVLDGAWQATVGGECRVVFLGGEPGIGKTRLAGWLARRAHDDGATVLHGRCDDELGVPYQPFVEALAQFVDERGHDPARLTLGQGAGELARLVPELRDLLPDRTIPVTAEPEVEQFWMFEAVAGWLAAGAGTHPLVLVIDDLQAATKPTLLLLRHVVRRAPARLCILVTYRDTGPDQAAMLSQFLAEVGRDARVERLQLRGLGPVDVDALIQATVGSGVDDGDGRLASAIHAMTDGNPFFVGEILRHIEESRPPDVVVGVAGLEIPAGVRDVVRLRLGRLTDDAVHLLVRASVLGAEFDVVPLERIVDLGDDAFVSALEEAVKARLVDTVGNGFRYRFCHSLVRAALYDDLSPLRRARLHRSAGAAIEDAYGARLDEHVMQLAHHFTRGATIGDAEKALRYCVRSAELSLGRRAPHEAVTFYRQALAVLDASAEDDAEVRCDLLLDLGDAQRRAADAGQRDTFMAVARLALDRHDDHRLLRAGKGLSRIFVPFTDDVDPERVAVLEAALVAAGPGDTAVKSRVMASLAGERVLSGDRHASGALSAEAVAVARRADDLANLATVLGMRWDIIFHPSTLAERRAIAAELAAVGHHMNDPFVMWRAAMLDCEAALEAGELAFADGRMRQAEAWAGQLREPTTRWMTIMARANVTVVGGAPDDAERLVLEAAAAGREVGSAELQASVAAALVEIRLFQGRIAELAPLAASIDLPASRATYALACCEAGQDGVARSILDDLAQRRFAALPHDASWPFGVALCAEVTARLGDAAHADVLHELLAPFRGQFLAYGCYWLGSVAHYLGVLSAAQGNLDRAVDELTVAVEEHHRLPAPAFVARTQLELVRVLEARGRSGDAPRAASLRAEALAVARSMRLAGVEEQLHARA